MFMAGFTSGVLFSMADGKQAESKNCPFVLTGHTCGSCAYSRQSFFQTLCWRGSLLADKHPKERKNVPALWKILSISSKKKCKKKKKETAPCQQLKLYGSSYWSPGYSRRCKGYQWIFKSHLVYFLSSYDRSYDCKRAFCQEKYPYLPVSWSACVTCGIFEPDMATPHLLPRKPHITRWCCERNSFTHPVLRQVFRNSSNELFCSFASRTCLDPPIFSRSPLLNFIYLLTVSTN